MANYTLKEIVGSFEQKRSWEKQFPVNYYIVRPLSFLITYLIIRLTDSPSQVAWIGFIIGLAGCVSFLGIPWWTAWPGVILLFAFSLLDAVDGNIARTTGNVTYYGKFLDGLLGEIIEANYCLCIGLGLSVGFSIFPSVTNNIAATNSSIFPLLSGVIIMGGRLFSSFIDLKYEYHLFEKQGANNRVKTNINDKIQSSTFRDKWYYQVFININLLNNQIIILVLCLWFGKITFFLYFLALYYLVRAIIYFIFFLRRAKQRLS